MRALASVLLVGSVGSASAETRLDTTWIPDLSILEPVYPPDGRYDDTRRRSLRGGVTLGFGEDVLASAMLAAGKQSDHVTIAATSELMSSGDAVVRGRHRGYLGLSLGERDDEDFGVRLELLPSLDHGTAAGLAPVALGAGRRDTSALHGHAIVQLSPEKDDFVLAASLDGEVGVSRRDGLDRAVRKSAGLGLGRVPVDGELPRGILSMLHGRVEHVAIARLARAAAAGDPGLAAGDAEVRIVELGIGPRELTFHVDREVLAVLDIDLGWSWLEADTGGGEPALAENMLRMRWSGALVAQKPTSRTQVGIAFGRQPTHSPDGQRLVSEWRVGLTAASERPRHVIDARGTLSWATSIADRPEAPRGAMLARYGTQLEAFAKLGRGLEAGGFVATWFEPAAGELWAAERRWSTEAGVALRFRVDPLARVQGRTRYECGGRAHSSPHLVPPPEMLPAEPAPEAEPSPTLEDLEAKPLRLIRPMRVEPEPELAPSADGD